MPWLSRMKLGCGLLLVCWFFFPSFYLDAQDLNVRWPAIHEQDLRQWSEKSGLTFKQLDEITKAARKSDAEPEKQIQGDDAEAEEDEDEDFHLIENVDARTLRFRHLILLSTWDYGTGHCLTLYAFKRTGNQVEAIFHSLDNFCTESVLGAATSRAMPDGRIIVKYRESPPDYDFERGGPVLSVRITYRWDGSTFVYARRVAKLESRGRSPV